MSVTIQIPESETGEFIPLIINIDYRKRLSLCHQGVSLSVIYTCHGAKEGSVVKLVAYLPLKSVCPGVDSCQTRGCNKHCRNKWFYRGKHSWIIFCHRGIKLYAITNLVLFIRLYTRRLQHICDMLQPQSCPKTDISGSKSGQIVRYRT